MAGGASETVFSRFTHLEVDVVTVALSQHACRHAPGNHAIPNGVCHHGARTNNRMAPHVGHDDSRAANPGALANPDVLFLTRLFTNGTPHVSGPVCLRSTRDVHTSSHEHVIFDDCPPNVTTWPKIGTLSQTRGG
jgi:hypothetical protein